MNGRVRTFRNVVVHPTQALLRPPFTLFRGGPDWPRFWLQVGARQCRYRIPVPLDLPPRDRRAPVAAVVPDGIWCGPVTRHFGHMIASFGARIAESSRLNTDAPLVFSARPGEREPPFLPEILNHFDVGAERLLLIDQPTRFERLSVVPQAERLFGGPPSAGHLELLGRINAPKPATDGAFFVSRANQSKGRIAGETYLETVFAAAGYATFRPEEHPLADQLAIYRGASRLVFTEGSALHALQLLGPIRAAVTVIVRRKGTRIAEAALRARIASLRYVDAVQGLVHGVRVDGRVQPTAGLTVLDGDRLVAGLADGGLSLAPHWDTALFALHRQADLGAWVEHRKLRDTHHSDAATIRATLRHVARGE